MSELTSMGNGFWLSFWYGVTLFPTTLGVCASVVIGLTALFRQSPQTANHAGFFAGVMTISVILIIGYLCVAATDSTR